MTRFGHTAKTLLPSLLPVATRNRLDHTEFRDAGHGYDCFGLDLNSVAAATGLTRLLYRIYFRVRSCGAQNIPARGGVILAANHSGTLPFDGAMLYHDVIEHTDPPRIPRALADVFVPRLPFVGTWFSRIGIVNGARGNVRHLLRQGELILVFPEGTPGIGKPFRDRYKLQQWRVGHAELALRCKAPVVPVAIIGAEEQWPLLMRIDGFHLLGAPYLPIPMVPFPLPVRYHIHYGEPIHFELPVESADDPAAVDDAAARIKTAVQRLIGDGLSARRGIFR